MPFAAFMSLALYDPIHGYYARGAQRTGWRGHFLTSPELDPAFGTLWARAFREVWARCGSPDVFEVVEVGPGEGGFAAAVLATVDDELASTLTYRMVERVPAVRARQQDRLEGAGRVEWSDSVTELPEIDHGVVFANEVLDNLPVHIVARDGTALVEVCVGAGADGLTFVDRPPSNPELELWVERTGTVPSDSGHVEVTLAAESMVAHLARRLGTGAIFLVDYGAEATEIERRGGTLLAYSESGVDERVLEEPGRRDITAHANWTSVSGALRRAGLAVEGPTEQRKVLLDLGARSLDVAWKEDHGTAIAEGRGADALKALSRRQALGVMLDPAGLGGLQVLAGYRGIDAGALVSQ
jgi:SAM-dependent MidA family methyltransferase